MSLDDVVAIWSQPNVLLVALLALGSVLLWRAPVLGLFFYPFRLFNTFIHELGHGVAALITGGEFHRFVVYPNREGVAQVRGGCRSIVVSAGYLGAALFGGLLILLTTAPLAAQRVLLALGLLMVLLSLTFVRNLFGFVAGLAIGVALAVAGWYLADQPATLLLFLLAIQMPLTALNSLLDLLRLSRARRVGEPPTDAQVMAELTHIPALVWALLWCLVAIAIVIVAVTLAFRDTSLYS